jgi:hypothetical protein
LTKSESNPQPPTQPPEQGPAGSPYRYVLRIIVLVGGSLLLLFVCGILLLLSGWRVDHLTVLQEQMAQLKELALEYRQAHGQYPTNDEGLAALDTFVSRFKFTLYRATDSNNLFDSNLCRFPLDFQRHLKIYAEVLRKEPGRLPSPGQVAARSIQNLFSEEPKKPEKPYQAFAAELAIAKNGEVYIITPGGIDSPWLLPYIYENRNGLDASAFAHSPVNRDAAGRYSVRVDDGVYIYSVGGESFAQVVFVQKALATAIGAVALALFIAAIVYAVKNVRQAKRRAVAFSSSWSAIFGTLLVGLAVMFVSVPGGHNEALLFSKYEPTMVVRQRELLDKYRGAGVISEETYRKSLAAVEPVKAQEPAAPKP